jgi:hypothetical protein
MQKCSFRVWGKANVCGAASDKGSQPLVCEKFF